MLCWLAVSCHMRQVLERVRAEQARVVRSHGPVMTPTALRDMPYTGAVLAESMRLRPIIGGAPGPLTYYVTDARYC